jgi:hypothetical protein
VATWRFLLRDRFDLNGEADFESLESLFRNFEAKDRTIVKLGLVGTISLRLQARLDRFLDEQRDLFAAVELWGRATDLAVLPDDDDFSEIDLRILRAVDRLRARALASRDDAAAARGWRSSCGSPGGPREDLRVRVQLP